MMRIRAGRVKRVGGRRSRPSRPRARPGSVRPGRRSSGDQEGRNRHPTNALRVFSAFFESPFTPREDIRTLSAGVSGQVDASDGHGFINLSSFFQYITTPRPTIEVDFNDASRRFATHEDSRTSPPQKNNWEYADMKRTSSGSPRNHSAVRPKTRQHVYAVTESWRYDACNTASTPWKAELVLRGLPRLLTIDEVAELLRVSRRTVTRWIHRGDLVSFKTGRKRLVPRAAVAEFLDGQGRRRPWARADLRSRNPAD